jgi:hypothetical protein
MTDTFRALCAELVDDLEEWVAYGEIERIEASHALITRARTALAQPETEGPSDDELLGLDELRDAWNSQADAVNAWDELGIDEIVWFAQQQALARWGRPTPEPVLAPEEVTELVAWLRDHARECRELGHDDRYPTRAAALLEQSPVTPEPVPASKRLPYLADCDAEGLFWGWNADSLSWELIHLKLFNNQFVNIYPFWLPYWDLPCPTDTTP